ncbi:P-loop NTPase fold protein [Kribbella sp. NPDC056951]|uniref:KAP family P-loop NTPase fold protein n=1 Tax=Kribbella sp. NPDC056951 TaxID=3345978 RepID=UPI003632E780
MAGPRTTDIDQPITRIEDDAFDFVPRYAVPLARRIAETPDSASLTIGIYGPWGSGKTSLMNLIQAKLAATPDKAPVIVSYTAWKFAQEQSLWRTLVRVILDELLKQTKPDAELRSLREALYRDVVKSQRKVRVDPVRLAGAITSAVTLGASSWLQAAHVSVPVATQVTLAGVALGGAGVTAFGMKLVGKSGGDAKKPDLAEQLGGQAKELIQAVEVVDDVLTTHYKAEHIEQFADSFQLVVDKFLNGRKLVIFIDDLDRCLPEKAIQVLEGIKLFLGVPGTVFVLGVDVAALVHAVEVHYAGTVPSAMNGGRYLEKIVQFPFHLPSMRSDEVTTKRLIDQLCSTPDDRDWLRIGVDGFAANPRAVKRFALLYRSRLEVMGGPANLHLAKLVVLQEHPQWRDLVEIVLEYTVSTPRSLLRDGPLAVLERASRNAAQRDDLMLADRPGLMSKLSILARDDGLMRFLASAPYFDEEGVDPVDPLPLLRLSGAAPGSSAPASLSLDDVVAGLLLPDAPIRATAVAAARQLPATSRQQLVERLLIEVAGRSQNPNPDAAGLPEYVDAVRICFEQQIERDQIAERLGWFTALADHGLNPDVATRSRQQLIQLTFDINKAPQSVPFIADEPTTTDLLDMDSHAQALVRTILQTPPPLTVGVLGEWGSGKSSFLRRLQDIFTAENGIRLAAVSAWITTDSDPISFTRFAFTELLGDGTLDPAATSAEQLRQQLAEAAAAAPDDDRRLVLLVDDLDRCVPSFVVDLLLTLNTVAPKSLVLILAVDPRWLSRAFEERFGRDEGQATIQRLITLPFSMPDIPASTLLTAEIADLGRLAPYIATSPREMKRFVNLLGLCRELVTSRGDVVDQRQLAVVLAIALRWPTLITDLSALAQLWNATHAVPSSQDEATRRATDELELLDPAALVSLLGEVPPPTEDELAQFVDLVRAAIPEER